MRVLEIRDFLSQVFQLLVKDRSEVWDGNACELAAKGHGGEHGEGADFRCD